MKCYICGNRLNEQDFCSSCGADVRVYKRIIYRSNALYNEGLSKALVRDLSGAADSLRQSLKFNKKNTDARNLLGLVYFEMGEAVLALSEWIISKNYESKKNIADDYINDLQSNPNQLDAISQTIKKYNQCLVYCYQDTLDLAIIQLKKILSINKNLISGYQLLTLLYLEGQDYEKARRTIMKALQIDANNTLSLKYYREANSAIREIAEHSTDKDKKKEAQETLDTISYQSGNELIIQPTTPHEKIGFSSIINIVLGLLIGVAICWFLILPSRLDKEIQIYDAKYIEVSEQLTAEKASHQETSQQLASAQEDAKSLQKEIDELTGASGILAETDYLFQAANIYINDSDDAGEVMDSLNNISSEYLQGASQPFLGLYDRLNKEAGSKAIGNYLDDAKSAMRQNDYATAIDCFTKAYNLDSTNSDILMQLAHAYRESGAITQANELYRKIMVDFAETQNAIDAEEYITE